MTAAQNLHDLLQQYDRALVRIAVFAPYKGRERGEPLQLIGATVTLLPMDHMVPARPVEPAKLRLGDKQGTIFFDYFIVDPRNQTTGEDRMSRNDEGVRRDKAETIQQSVQGQSGFASHQG